MIQLFMNIINIDKCCTLIVIILCENDKHRNFVYKIVYKKRI